MRVILIQLLLLASLFAQDTHYRVGSWRGRTVAYRVVNGMAIAEGDILLENVQEAEYIVPSSKDPHRHATGVTGDAFRWPNRTVPYLIDAAVPNQKRITDAVQHWNDNSLIKMVARTDEKNYVRFIRDNTTGTCSSFVGMLGGEQRITTNDTCVTGSFIHELGHAVGLNHEQSRIDRDTFVKVNWDAIDKRFFHDFDQAIGGSADYGLYDYGSIMHYPAGGGEITSLLSSLETIPRGIPIGQRDGLSPGDLDAVKRMYGEPVTATVVTTCPTGLDMIVDGSHFTSPKSFDWAPGSTHSVDVTSQQGTSRVRLVFGRWNDGGEQSHTITASPDIGVFEAGFVRQFSVGKDPFPANGGTVTFDPPSDDGYYADGTPVTVTAQPAPGFYFVSWSLIPGGTHGLVDNPAQTRITGNWDYGPFFDTVPLNIVLDSKPAHRLVSVDSSSHTAQFGDTYKSGSTHTISTGTQLGPQSVARYTFTGWSDNGSLSHSVTATDTPVSYTANFRTDYLMSLSIDGPVGTTIERIPASTDGFYESGTQVQLIPHPAPGFQFVNWFGDTTGNSLAPAITVDGQKAVTAVFRATGSTPLNGVLNAATMQPGFGAPGELLVVNGTQGAPDGTFTGQPNALGTMPILLANTGVAVDTIYAPLISVNGNQVTTMIPFSRAGKTSVPVFIVYGNKPNTAALIDLVSAVPGIFTVDGSGSGAAKVANEDGSDNAAANPAARGSMIKFRGTGFGKMTPAMGDYSVVGDNPPAPELPVSVSIGGADAAVVSALGVKGSLGGLVEVTVQVPDGAPSGVVRLALKVGTQVARQFVTVAIQ